MPGSRECTLYHLTNSFYRATQCVSAVFAVARCPSVTGASVCVVCVWCVYSKVKMVPRFKEYDRDGNGYVSLDEATSILQSAPFNFPASKVGQLLQKFDKDGNGKLDIEEFADFYAEAKATYVHSSSIYLYLVGMGVFERHCAVLIDSSLEVQHCNIIHFRRNPA